MIKKKLLYTLCLFLMYAFTKSHSLHRYELNGYAQGTTYTVIYFATDSVISMSQIDSLLYQFDQSFSLYQPNSIINQFNQSAKGIRISQPFQTIIRQARLINLSTNGLVDPTVKPLVDAWGFGTVKSRHYPDQPQLNHLLQHVGLEKLYIKGNYLFKKDAAIQLDLNGIAQGYSVDLLASLLEQFHINNYMIELGGELRVKGEKANDEPFVIGIEGISDDNIMQGPMRKLITFKKGGITTSGNYRNYYETGGNKISHLINPKTGYPVDNEMISVTVYAKDAVTADGYDNGFMAMGLHKTLAFISGRKDMGAYIVYHKADGSIADTMTSVFKKLIKKD